MLEKLNKISRKTEQKSDRLERRRQAARERKRAKLDRLEIRQITTGIKTLLLREAAKGETHADVFDMASPSIGNDIPGAKYHDINWPIFEGVFKYCKKSRNLRPVKIVINIPG